MSPHLLPAPVEFHITGQNDDPLRQARDNVARVALDWGLPLSRHAISDLKLCTTEVVANALKHAGGECWIKVIWTGEHLKVEVHDRSLRLPYLSTADETAESGRGLFLVEAFTQSWGWEPKGLGKVVFFIVGPDQVTDDQRLGQLVRAANAVAPPTPASEVSEARVLMAAGLVLV